MSNKETSRKRTLQGTVTNIIDEKTAKIEVERKYPHPKYGKIVKVHRRYLVDTSKKVDFEIGDEVVIESTRPISKNKSWMLRGKLT